MEPSPVNNKHKVPSELALTAYLSGGLTLILSVIYTVLSILALVYRYQCEVALPDNVNGDQYFISTVYRFYIQKDCDNPESSPPAGVQLMSDDTVCIFVLIILIASVFCFAAAVTLITVVATDKRDYIFAVSWTFVCICLSSLVVDLVFAVFFGIDYAEITSIMENLLPGVTVNYRFDVHRLGALLFMTISLKGYLAPFVIITLLVFLAVYATKYRTQLQTEEHSIHKMGAINAYEQQQVNRGFINDEPRRSPRTPDRPVPHTPLSEYSNLKGPLTYGLNFNSIPPRVPEINGLDRQMNNKVTLSLRRAKMPSRHYDRSDSWQHSPAPRPFSYVEEPRRTPRSSSYEPQWRRDPWPPAPPMPPVPAPDYSPPPARRLKSALKPNYM